MKSKKNSCVPKTNLDNQKKSKENGRSVQSETNGYDHGVHDGLDGCRHSDGCHWYILKPGEFCVSYTGI
jgi:hypothetical protein